MSARTLKILHNFLKNPWTIPKRSLTPTHPHPPPSKVNVGRNGGRIHKETNKRTTKRPENGKQMRVDRGADPPKNVIRHGGPTVIRLIKDAWNVAIATPDICLDRDAARGMSTRNWNLLILLSILFFYTPHQTRGSFFLFHYYYYFPFFSLSFAFECLTRFLVSEVGGWN